MIGGDTNGVAVVGGSGMIRGSPELDSNTCSFLVHLTSVPEAYADHLSRSQLHIHRPRPIIQKIRDLCILNP